jgi:uncharacterized membrane protein YgcG
MRAFDGWIRASRQGNRAEWKFLQDSFLSRNTLMMIAEMRKQFADLLVDVGFAQMQQTKVRAKGKQSKGNRGSGHFDIGLDPVMSENGGNLQLCKAVLCAGLYPNVIQVVDDKKSKKNDDNSWNENAVSLKTRDGDDCALHPCSVNFNDESLSGYLIYHEQVKTSKVYLRDCSAVSPYPLMLFGGQLKVWHREQVITVDNWLAFRAPRRVAVLVRLLRDGLEEIMRRKIAAPDAPVSDTGEKIIQALSRLLRSEVGEMSAEDLKRELAHREKQKLRAKIKVEKALLKGLDKREGDWQCPKCKCNCFASRMNCFKCNEPKPLVNDESHQDTILGGRGRGGGGRRGGGRGGGRDGGRGGGRGGGGRGRRGRRGRHDGFGKKSGE